LSTAGTVITGVSVANNLVNGNTKGVVTDILEFGISKTAAAPYYYSGKIIKEVFTGNTTMSKAYFEWEGEKKGLINNFRYYQQQGDEGEMNKIREQLIRIEKGQAMILNTLQERKQSDD